LGEDDALCKRRAGAFGFANVEKRLDLALAGARALVSDEARHHA
jgi:hypothetical protein